jgi:hypothetical protein
LKDQNRKPSYNNKLKSLFFFAIVIVLYYICNYAVNKWPNFYIQSLKVSIVIRIASQHKNRNMHRNFSKYAIHIVNRIVLKNKYRDMYRDRKKWQCTALILRYTEPMIDNLYTKNLQVFSCLFLKLFTRGMQKQLHGCKLKIPKNLNYLFGGQGAARAPGGSRATRG